MRGRARVRVTTAILGVKLKVMAANALAELLADPPSEVDKYQTPPAQERERFAFHVSAELADAVMALAKSYAQEPPVTYQDIIDTALKRVPKKRLPT